MADEETKAPDEETPPAKSGLLLRLGLWVGVVVLGAGGGYAMHFVLRGPATAAGEEVAEEPAGKDEYQYYAMDPVTVTLDTPQKNRYLRATIQLAIRKKHFEKAQERIEARKPVIVDTLNVYLGALTLDDVGGIKKQNKIRRELLDDFNHKLWPGEKPLIEKLFFHEWALQ